ncbi:MAG: polysaccharide ABC transporter ATP-binding protein [Pelobium sp.]
MSIAIKVENLSKAYQLGEIGTGTISRDLERYWAKLRGKEDPFLKIGETNDRTKKGTSDMVWSLKDLNFEIEQGDAVGIIGRNGAGKSTLLKILSRVTSPTTGRVRVKGRVASLLEVGTGFHPELTGRENIFLNGAILGMRKKEITRKFEEIVDFAGVERYIDTPVKRYSSGMYVRLAFAVAAHLESEVLVVDEVLAVGDAEFQKKCIGKMNDVSKGEGRTVLFVSHNMGSIRELCSNSILLKNGLIDKTGNTNSIISFYEQTVLNGRSAKWKNEVDNEKNTEVFLESISISDRDGIERINFLNSEEIHLSFHTKTSQTVNMVKIGFDIISKGQVVFRSQQVDSNISDKFIKGENDIIKCIIPANYFNVGEFYIRPLISIHTLKSLTKIYDTVTAFTIGIDSSRTQYHGILNESNHPGVTFPIFLWKRQLY